MVLGNGDWGIADVASDVAAADSPRAVAAVVAKVVPWSTDPEVALYDRDGVIGTWPADLEPSPDDISTVQDCLDAGDIRRPAEERLVVPVQDLGVLELRAERGFADVDMNLVRDLAALALLAARDQTTLAQREERIEQLERENEQLVEFAEIVSHDLRNPLSVARGYLELAEESGEPSHFEDVRAAHDRMEAIVQHTLSVARDAEGTPEVQPVDLADLGERAWESVETGDAALVVEDVGTIEAQSERLRQLL